MLTGKGKARGPSDRANAGRRAASSKAESKGYTSAAWERVYLMSLELAAVARELGLPERPHAGDGFDVADAAREVARLASNYNRALNPGGRNAEAEREDWVSVGGLGADLGNMAEEGLRGAAADLVRPVAHELCYLACDYLF